MKHRTRVAALLLLAMPVLSLGNPTQSHLWNFRVSLGDKPIGTHTFVLQADAGDTRLVSTAHFVARFALVYHYHYDHDAIEHWQNDVLVSLDARTDDDGSKNTVRVRRVNEHLQAIGGSGISNGTLSGCEMSFAYWNPAMLKQSHLLNAQTGECEPVSFTDLGHETLEVRGKGVSAHRYTLHRASLSMDLWYSETGEWLALDAQTPQKKTLHYRLE